MAPVSRNLLESSPDKTILINDGSVRVRLLTTDTLPYLGRLSGPKEALLFDLAQKRTDLKYINGNNMANIPDSEFYETNADAGGDATMEVDGDKENLLLDPNLTLEGNPLEVKYDTVDEMRKKIRAAKFTQSCNEIDVRFPIECNPFTTVESDKWLKSLSFESHKWLDSQFGNVWIFIATDASDGRKMMITGMRKTPHTRLMVSLLGKGGAAFKKIGTMLSSFSNNPSRKYVYADYEIFKRRSLIDKPEIDPTSAIFRIHVEWPISGHVKWLSKPPIDTPMTITFSPGWLNSHVGLLERSEEVEYLLTLSQWLLKGETQWPKQELEPYIVDDVATLISQTSVVNNETNKSDAINDDFTFKLWLILRKCKSFATLRSCLELVLKSIRYGEITALVGNENKSTIAHMLRSSAKNEYPVSRLEPLQCVGLLLELGVDYMKCVMTNDFLSCGFIQNVADLNNVFVDASLGIEYQANGLLPIHLAFQTVNCLQEYIKNTSHELVNLTRRALHKFCESKVKPLPAELFVFDVKGTVHDWVFCDATLSDWCLHRTAFSGKEPRVEHYFHFSSRVEFSHISNRLYLPREQDQPKQPDVVAQKQDELQQTFLQPFDYSAKEHFYGAATVLSHIRI
uniref:Protein zwilch n=1 Tax=Panagrolaimus sp. PS1159 TaxID=55785 RepID=A0AC35F8S9_9BILA